MARLVFFGMRGGFSAVVLTALANARFEVALVVQGQTRGLETLGDTTEVVRAGPSWLERLGLAGRRAPPVSPPAPEAEARAPHDAAEAARTDRPPPPPDLTRVATARGIDVVVTTNANTPAVRRRIGAAQPDALVVAGFPHLLAPEILALARCGGLNLHPGKLPEERGPSPLFWALKAGRTAIDYTVHVLAPGEDSGDVVSTGRIAFEPGADGEDVLTHCATAAVPQLIGAVRALTDGDLVRHPQPTAGVGRCPRPTFRDGLIDAGRPAREVFTFVAGCARTHSVFAECGGDRFFIRRALSFDPEGKLPCEFVLTGDRLLLACHPGVVELELKEDGVVFSAEYA